MRKLLFQEDDCAPDAREYFVKALKAETGMLLVEFQLCGKKVEVDELTTEWRHGDYILRFCGDDPFYELLKEVK